MTSKKKSKKRPKKVPPDPGEDRDYDDLIKKAGEVSSVVLAMVERALSVRDQHAERITRLARDVGVLRALHAKDETKLRKIQAKRAQTAERLRKLRAALRLARVAGDAKG